MIRRQTSLSLSRLLLGAGLPLTAGLLSWAHIGDRPTIGREMLLFTRRHGSSIQEQRALTCGSPSATKTNMIVACSTSNEPSLIRLFPRQNDRQRKTPADKYFEETGNIPLPPVVHAILPPRRSQASGGKRPENILIIGDVHGCFDELQMLHDNAIQENNGSPFEYVILVGDLCNKGPESARVVRFVRKQENWFSVRGNHDDGALTAALGDEKRRKKKKYQWVMDGEHDLATPPSSDPTRITLSDDDVVWLSELPYTLTIPRSYFQDSTDTIIVHGGLVPGKQLESQTIDTMTTIREVISRNDPLGGQTFDHFDRRNGSKPMIEKESSFKDPQPWALLWKVGIFAAPA